MISEANGGSGDDQLTTSDNRLSAVERAMLEFSKLSDEFSPQPVDSIEHDTFAGADAAPAPAATQNKPVSAAQNSPSKPSQPKPAAEGAANVHVGPGAKLKGDITGCDTIRVEGTIEGDIVARQLILCPGGSFIGTAEVDEAEIEGKFEGTLAVHGRLKLHSSGRIDGTVDYGRIEIESGGEIAGPIAPHAKQIPAPLSEPTSDSVSDGRRALSPVPKPQHDAQSSRPAARAGTPPAHVPASKPVLSASGRKPAWPTAAASDGSSKSRRMMFFSRG